MALLYKHIRKDTNVVFYIGIAKSKRRVNSKQSRNKYWHNITNKTEWYSEIMYDNITEKEAEKLEKFYIKKYKRKCDGGLLCNITKGGKGLKGYKHTQDYKDNLSKRMKGNKLSEETKNKISNAHKNKKLSIEHKFKISKSHKGKKMSKSFIKKVSKKILQFDKNNNFLKEYNSLTEASILTNTQVGHISKVCYNKRKTAGGYKWKFKNE